MRNTFLVLVLLVLSMGSGWAVTAPASGPGQEAEKWSYATLPKASEEAVSSTLPQAESDSDEKYFWDRREERQFKYNALIALSCTTVVLYLFAAIMLFRLPERAKGQHLIHLTSLALIIYGTLTLALLPTTSDGLTAPIGILGALAGYLFGHASPKSGGSSREDKD
ncbi:MAG: hypothetical protein H6R13_872 [Proteobacteria bacterium]|nr:hypothetical protein [Pseudomonadota bacterium]